MNKAGKRLVVAAIVVVIFIVLSIVNLFIYPFKSSQPNFADVERVFNKIEIPADWVEISSSENSGIAGRACPIEPGTACFHKSKTFNVSRVMSNEEVITTLEMTGCSNVAVSDNSYAGESKIRSNLECSIEGLSVYSETIVESGSTEVFVGVST